MKKIFTTALALMMVLSLAACGGKADTPASTPSSTAPSTAPSSSAASVASTAPEAVDVSNWIGTYQTAESDEQIIVFIVTAEECRITYRGKTAAAKVKAVHDIGDGAMELQMLDKEDLLHHLVYFPTNEPQKQFSFSVTKNGDPSTQIVNSCFMSSDSPIAKGDGATASSDASTPAQSSSQDNTPPTNDAKITVFKNIGTLEELPVSKHYTPKSDNYLIQHGKLREAPSKGDYRGCSVTFFYYDENNELIDMERVDFIETAQLDTFYQYQSKDTCTTLGTEGIYTVVKYDSPDEYVTFAREDGETKEVRYGDGFESLYKNFQEMWDYGADAYYFSE